MVRKPFALPPSALLQEEEHLAEQGPLLHQMEPVLALQPKAGQQGAQKTKEGHLLAPAPQQPAPGRTERLELLVPEKARQLLPASIEQVLRCVL